MSREEEQKELEKIAKIEAHRVELQAYGLGGLEGRLKRGLDPAGMLAVGETRSKIKDIATKTHTDLTKTDELTKELHVGAVWKRAKELAEAKTPEVRLWMLLAHNTKEKNDTDISTDDYLADVERLKKDLVIAQNDPEVTIEKAVQAVLQRAHKAFIKIDGVPFAEYDAFLYMAIAGEKYGISKAGELYFVGADKIDYTILKQEGLQPTKRIDRGREVTFYQRDGKDIVKELYPGLAIVFGDEALALRLAKSAEKFIEKQPK